MNEISNATKRIEKTKDSKSQLALLQKRLKNHNQFKEYHQNRREMLIEKLNFWIDNMKRDQGVTKPYLFVVLSLYSLAEKEVVLLYLFYYRWNMHCVIQSQNKEF